MAEKKSNNVSKDNNFITNKPIFSWQSPEFVSYKRDAKWIVGIIAIVLVLLVILVFQKLWTGAGMVAVAGVLFLVISNTKPKEIACAVYNEGIVVDKKVYNFNQFKSFWLVNGALPKLLFQLTGRLAGQITMPLDDMDPEQIRMFISKHLPEEDEKSEDFTDIINRLFRL